LLRDATGTGLLSDDRFATTPSLESAFSSWNEAVAPVSSAARSVEAPSSGATSSGIIRDYSESTARFDTSFGGSGQNNSFGGLDPRGGGFSPTPISDSRWSADWSSDSGWQGGMSETDRSSGFTPPAPARAPVFHNNGWLANPDR